jgi:hypothetical protein
MASQVSSIVSMMYANELTTADNTYEAKKAYIEANVTDEVEKAKQLAALEVAHAAEVAVIKTKQFKAQQTADIISAVISTAQAVMSTFKTYGFTPWGIAAAAAMAALGAAQIAVITSQPVPVFAAEGGVFYRGESVIVGERGPELLTVGATSVVTPNDELTRAALQSASDEAMFLLTLQLDGRVIVKRIGRAIKNRELIIEAKDIA